MPRPLAGPGLQHRGTSVGVSVTLFTRLFVVTWSDRDVLRVPRVRPRSGPVWSFWGTVVWLEY